MKQLLKSGYRAKKRPSGHDISTKFRTNNGAAIPPNLIALPNTESNSSYLRFCKAKGIHPHPARYPSGIPEYFIRMLTDPGDLVVDPFGGSCVTGEVAERLKRKWMCIEMRRDYLEGAAWRFEGPKRSKGFPAALTNAQAGKRDIQEDNFYRIPRPGILWDHESSDQLREDGGRKRLKPT